MAIDQEYFIRDEKKFSTLTFELVFSNILNKEAVEKRNVLGQTLIQATKEYASKLEMRSYLADLFATQVRSGTSKNGALHEIVFQFSFVHPSIADDEHYTMETIYECIEQVILHPALEGDAFLEKIFAVENRMMQNKIKGIYNNKTQYAQTRLFEEMFQGTPYAVKSYGELENYSKLSREDVTQAYVEMLLNDHLQIYVIGDIREQRVIDEFQKMFEPLKRSPIELPKKESFVHERLETQLIVERQAVNQTKLHLGYQMDVALDADEYVIAQVAITVLGGGSHSKLFQNVREKASLAYYVAATSDMLAQSLFIYAGIDEKQKDQAISIIDEQIADMKNGKVSDEELLISKEQIIHSIAQTQDSPFGIITLEKSMARVEGLDSISAWLEAIEKVTVTDVCKFAKTWKKDTTYILAPEKEGEMNE